MSRRKPGLQSRWRPVVDSLERIIPVYEKGSSRISLFSDRAMRSEVASFAVRRRGELVLDLGAGPGTLSRVVAAAGGTPILIDASGMMLRSASPKFDRVQCVFEFLPFREGSFESAVAGFSLRDSRDLASALTEIRRVILPQGRFAFCDLGKPESTLKATGVAFYIFFATRAFGFLSGGPAGLRFGSLFDTYRLVLDNALLKRALENYFGRVDLVSRQFGAAIVVRCVR